MLAAFLAPTFSILIASLSLFLVLSILPIFPLSASPHPYIFPSLVKTRVWWAPEAILAINSFLDLVNNPSPILVGTLTAPVVFPVEAFYKTQSEFMKLTYSVLSPKVYLIQICVISNGMTVTCTNISRWDCQCVCYFKWGVFSAFSAESALIITSPCIDLAHIWKGYCMHTSTDNF